MNEELVVSEDMEGLRIDVFISQILAEKFSRSQVKRMIEARQVLAEGRTVSAHYRVKKSECITILSPDQKPFESRAENIPLEIIFEDESLIVVNKPAGMVVHPAHGNLEHTLVNALLYHIQELSKFKDPVRPGIVHRLDKDTSGILVVAKNEPTHRSLARQFKNHTIDRIYHALVRGVVQHDEGVCEEPVGRAFLNRKKIVIKPSGGKEAETHYKVLQRFKDATLLEIRPKTGRTHQIRVHMAFLEHPVLGDPLYGFASDKIARHALHAKSLGFTHPATKDRMFFDSPLPDDIARLIAELQT